jgi:Alkaline phosphatase
MVYSGYSTPKNYSVLGMDKYLSNIDKKPYQLLTYSSGLGHSQYNETISLQDVKNSYHKAAIASTWANHAADDVPLYAIGAMSKLLFAGTFDQTYVPHAIAYAMCLFNYKDRCQSQAYVKRVKGQSKKKASGMDALIEELNRRNRNEEIQQMETSSIASEIDTNNSNTIETLDLIGNFSIENYSNRIFCNRRLVLIIIVIRHLIFIF